MPITWPGIARYSLVGSYGEQEIINILDVDVDLTGVGDDDRETELFNLAGDIINNWVDHILPLVHANYQLNEVRWVDLDTLAGTTGSRTTTSDNTLPVFGEYAGTGMPGNVYVKVTKVLQGKNRTERNGMLRLAGVPESVTADADVNSILDTHANALNAAFEQFKDGINGTSTSATRNIGVVHTVNQVATGFSVMSEFNVKTGLGTIRRRMPGYGS